MLCNNQMQESQSIYKQQSLRDPAVWNNAMHIKIHVEEYQAAWGGI